MKKTILTILFMVLLNITMVFAVDNISNLTKGNQTFIGIVEFADEVTNDLLGPMFIIVLFIILFSAFIRKHSFEESVLVSGFFCMGFSILMNYIGLLPIIYLIIFSVIIVLVLLLAFIRRL